MWLEEVIASLESERDAVNRAIDALASGGTNRRRRRRRRSAEARKRISEAMKRSWAKRPKRVG